MSTSGFFEVSHSKSVHLGVGFYAAFAHRDEEVAHHIGEFLSESFIFVNPNGVHIRSLRDHFEQNFHVRARLDRYNAGPGICQSSRPNSLCLIFERPSPTIRCDSWICSIKSSSARPGTA
jgi:hypothetical protein